MKLYLALIVAAVLMAFATSYLAISIMGSHTSTTTNSMQISKLKFRFKTSVPPNAFLNLDTIYKSSNRSELFNPQYSMTDRHNLKDKNREIFQEKCFSNISTIVHSFFSFGFFNFRDSEKALLWENYRCGKIKRLPNVFFKRPPYIHPIGRSYAYFAITTGKKAFLAPDWIKSHLPYFHISELKEIKKIIGKLGGIFDILEEFNNDTLKRMAHRQETLVSRNSVLFKNNNLFHHSTQKYNIYGRDNLNNFLKNSPYVVSNYTNGEKCFFQDGGLCWNYNVKHLFKLAGKSTILLFIGSIALIITVVLLLLGKIRGQKREDEKKRFALRVLTHEFRTPVASMLLQIDRGNKLFDSMDDDIQQVFMRLSNDVYRLQRLTETSRNYLRAGQNKKMIEFNFTKIESINGLMEQYIDTHIDKLNFHPLKNDTSFTTDTYWMGICIKNILENAFTHGKPPIEMRLNLILDKFEIEIQDAGECEFSNIKEISYPFVKGSKSGGTGLGLNIVKQIVEQLGGRLIMKTNPTIFKLTIRNHP